jgi:hypothetical protein
MIAVSHASAKLPPQPRVQRQDSSDGVLTKASAAGLLTELPAHCGNLFHGGHEDAGSGLPILSLPHFEPRFYIQ